MSKNLSLEDIAKISGFSRSTVSRVVNNESYVRPETRHKILQTIAEHGYQPNLAARTLASKQSKTIGVLIPHDISDLFNDLFFPPLLKHMTIASSELGYGVALWLAVEKDGRQYIYHNAFNNSIIDGLLIASATIDHSFLDWLKSFSKPVVFVGASPLQQPNISWVDIDNRGGAKLAVQHLIQEGCRRIGMIAGRANQIASDHRLDGYWDALKEADFPLDPELVIPEGNYTEIGGYTGMKQLLTKGVDGVFAANDMSALGALRAIQEAGYQAPDDIALIGFDDMPFATLTNPPLSTIHQPIGKLGAEAATLLINYLEDNITYPTSQILPVELIVRKSSKKS